jgi:Regulator of chromosome condensation (RCC1) repeat/Putative Ig domain
MGVLALGSTVAAASPAAAAGSHSLHAPSSGPNLRELDAYGFDTCALLADGSAQCWGDGFADDENHPTGTYTQIAVGGGGDCGLTAAASPVTCWSEDSLYPPPSSGTYTAVSGGYETDCALSTAGAMTCWGNTLPDLLTEPGPFSTIADGNGEACGITTTGAIDCYNYANPTPLPSPPAGAYKAVTMGGAVACALSTADAISCWGDDTYGETGAPTTGKYVAVAAGDLFACALSTTGAVTCWGSNSEGQLDTPAGSFTAISAGSFHACGITTAGYVKCWGYDNFGQLGAAPFLNTGPAPDGLDGFIYFFLYGSTQTLSGNPPGTFTVSSGSLPPGLTLDPNYGILQGTPTTPGKFPFTVSISNVEGALSARADVIVRGYFLGFSAPKSPARISKTHRVAVQFRLGSYGGTPVAAKYATGLRLRVTVSAHQNGAHAIASANCSYNKARRAYVCSLSVPKKLATGRKHHYFLTAYQQTSSGYQQCPAGKARTDANPLRIYFG